MDSEDECVQGNTVAKNHGLNPNKRKKKRKKMKGMKKRKKKNEDEKEESLT
ncbi:Hypothetical predicted protein, partial [Paramuricea clavata]